MESQETSLSLEGIQSFNTNSVVLQITDWQSIGRGMFNAICFFFLLCRFIFIVIHLFHFVNLFHRRKPLRGKHVKSNENLDHVVNKKIEEFVVTASRFLKVQNIVSGQRK